MKSVYSFLLLAVTTGSAQWGQEVLVHASNNPCGLPVTYAQALGANGDTLHAVWAFARLYYQRSTNCGASWSQPRVLTSTSESPSDASISVSGDTVHVVWASWDSLSNGTLRYLRSTDGGSNWDSIRSLAREVTLVTPSVATSGKNVFAVWQISRVALHYCSSTDGGEDWGAAAQLPGDIYEPEAPSVAIHGSDVHVAWDDYSVANLEIWHVRSSDLGTTWGTPVRVSFTPWMSGPPTLGLCENFVHLAWREFDHDTGDHGVYYSGSTDDGATWSQETLLSTVPTWAEAPSLTADGRNVHVAWSDRRSGAYEIYYRHSPDAGISWDPEVPLTNAGGLAYGPSVATSGPRVSVLYPDHRNTMYELYSRTDTTGNTGVFENDGSRPEPNSTIVRGALIWSVMSPTLYATTESLHSKSELLDIAGRKVLDLHPGANDVGRLAPGVYFVRWAGGRQSETKIVIQH